MGRMGPRLNAKQGWSVAHKIAAAAALLVPAGLAFVDVKLAYDVVAWTFSVLFAAVIGVKVVAIVAGFIGRHTIQVEAEAVRALTDAELPIYTVLLPLYDEPQILEQLIASLSELDYPRDKLDIMLLLEADDRNTQQAAERHRAMIDALGARVVIVPDGTPRTKPRACNYGLEQARGELLVIYDAEDWPEPDQLKKAVVAFRRLGPQTACLQAKLNYYNYDHNLLTRMFALEYTAWFDLYLPGLHAIGAPIPLGGTSNHFRTEVLRELGGWDAFNVTEDADLGIHLARAGLGTSILDSTTWEESTSRYLTWIKQRSHWVKGYVQTFKVHTQPLVRNVRELGPWKALLVALSTGGSVMSMVVGVPAVAFFGVWLYTYLHDPLWQAERWRWGFSVSLFISTGYFVLVHMVGAAQRRRFSLIPFALLLPFYWVMMGLAAMRGVVQYVRKPFHWDKTPHGLSLRTPPPAAAVAAVAGAPDASAVAASRVNQIQAAHRKRLAPHLLQSPLLSRHRPAKATAAAALALGMAVVPFTIFKPRQSQAHHFQIAIEQSWHGRKGVDVKLVTTTLAHARSIAPTLVAFVKVLDGEWYQYTVTSYQRDENRISFSLPLDRGWRGEGHDRPWGPWCLRRVREFGVRVYGPADQAAANAFEVRKLDLTGEVADEQPPRFEIGQPFPAAVDTYRVYEARFAVNRDFANPFDAGEVDITGVFELPSGEVRRVPAFYSQDFTRRQGAQDEELLSPTGRPFWAVRFAAPLPGRYRFHLEGKAGREDLGRSAPQELSAASSGRDGYVRIDPATRRFQLEPAGKAYYPIALNLRSPGDDTGQQHYDFQVPRQNEGALRMEAYVRRMGQSGISMARVWLASWFGGLEWRRDVTGYHGLGQYNLQNAWRIDHVLATAAEAGVHIELLLFPHPGYQPEYLEPWGWSPDSDWRVSPHNAANGGPVADAREVLTNPEARRGARNYLRYLAARYGADPALFGWTLWNEVDTISTDPAVLAAWHREMGPVLRAADLGRHVISTEFRTSGYPEVWKLPEIDYVQAEAYDHDNEDGLVGRFDRIAGELRKFGKTAVIEEYGGGWWGGSMNLLAQNIHDGLWAGWTKDLPSTPMAWWWNLVFEKRLDQYYRAFAGYVKGEDLRGKSWRSYVPRVTAGDRELRALANQSADVAYVWIYDPKVTERVEPFPQLSKDGPNGASATGAPRPDGGPGLKWADVAAQLGRGDAGAPVAPLDERYLGGNAPELFDEVRAAEVELRGLTDGAYSVELWDTWVARPPQVKKVHVARGVARVALPPLTRDLALKLRRQDATVAAGAATP